MLNISVEQIQKCDRRVAVAQADDRVPDLAVQLSEELKADLVAAVAKPLHRGKGQSPRAAAQCFREVALARSAAVFEK